MFFSYRFLLYFITIAIRKKYNITSTNLVFSCLTLIIFTPIIAFDEIKYIDSVVVDELFFQFTILYL